ncbi:hypothetical protein [Pseudoalteromonas sp.]|uniref:hypothetical protein n=1 Tax=Pseudoalteromonas sp. TaxID=53249 RepID=UPI001BD015E1|nr:hypothetical protein [Pseudoalteromonas sp.]
MKVKQVEPLPDENTTEQERQAYYRACIVEFQKLGYQEQYLAELTDELVPVMGVNSNIPNAKSD